MIHKDDTYLKIIHKLILHAREMAYKKEEYSLIANLLDDIEYLQGLVLGKDNNSIDKFDKYLIGIDEKYGYTGLTENFNKVNNIQEEISSDKKNISKKKYIFEIKFNYLDKKVNLLEKLKKVALTITKSQILGQGIEHDSVHYIESIYIKWIKDDILVKFYIDDYTHNSLCCDISSPSAKVSYDTSMAILRLLKSVLVGIEITKKWEVN